MQTWITSQAAEVRDGEVVSQRWPRRALSAASHLHPNLHHNVCLRECELQKWQSATRSAQRPPSHPLPPPGMRRIRARPAARRRSSGCTRQARRKVPRGLACQKAAAKHAYGPHNHTGGTRDRHARRSCGSPPHVGGDRAVGLGPESAEGGLQQYLLQGAGAPTGLGRPAPARGSGTAAARRGMVSRLQVACGSLTQASTALRRRGDSWRRGQRVPLSWIRLAGLKKKIVLMQDAGREAK